MEVQEATIQATGDVSDPGPLGLVVTIAETLAGGDEELATALLVSLAEQLRDEEIELLR